MIDERRNWAGNQVYGAAEIHHPASVAEVQRLVADAHRVRAVGARHSFSASAATPGDLLALDRLDRVLDIDTERRTVTIEGGVRYAALCPALDRAGLALPNLASLSEITVVGASATATHGSGDRNQLLAAAVAALDLVTADGELITLSRRRDGDTFRSALVGLGALGVIVRLTLDLVPAFRIRQTVYEGLPAARLAADFDAIMGGAYSVSIFTDWGGPRGNMVWTKRRVDDAAGPEPGADYFGARPAPDRRTLGEQAAGARVTAQSGVPGPWHERLPHFRPEAMPSTGAELQSEYFVPRRHGPAAVRAFATLGERIGPALLMSEIRTIAADDFWLSPFNGQASVGFHCTWHPDWPAVRRVLPLIEGALAPFDVRPHWGKLFTLAPDHLRALYPRLPEFGALQRHHDPTGKFRNAFLDRYILAAISSSTNSTEHASPT